VTPEQARERRSALDEACRREDRDPGTLRFTMMNGFLVGADRDDLRDRARRLADWRGESDKAAADLDGWIAETTEPWIVGTPDEMVARLREYEAAGIDGVMLQHHLFGDLEALELIGREVIPALT
jgi:alkanesulfonate monooxygenase SsuD/methylene tetrahydromethanopterin reductase-like flavin-dependent oxidoreductase (luciferase family)